MFKYIFYLTFLISTLGFAQQQYVYYAPNVSAPLSHQEIVQFEEVFGNDATYVMERPSLLQDLKDLIRNRVVVQEIPREKAQGAAIYRNAIDLSSVPMYNVFNPTLKRDINYTKESFNILKYKIGFFPEKKTIYKLGNHYISVLPQVKNER